MPLILHACNHFSYIIVYNIYYVVDQMLYGAINIILNEPQILI